MHDTQSRTLPARCLFLWPTPAMTCSSCRAPAYPHLLDGGAEISDPGIICCCIEGIHLPDRGSRRCRANSLRNRGYDLTGVRDSRPFSGFGRTTRRPSTPTTTGECRPQTSSRATIDEIHRRILRMRVTSNPPLRRGRGAASGSGTQRGQRRLAGAPEPWSQRPFKPCTQAIPSRNTRRPRRSSSVRAAAGPSSFPAARLTQNREEAASAHRFHPGNSRD